MIAREGVGEVLEMPAPEGHWKRLAAFGRTY